MNQRGVSRSCSLLRMTVNSKSGIRRKANGICDQLQFKIEIRARTQQYSSVPKCRYESSRMPDQPDQSAGSTENVESESATLCRTPTVNSAMPIERTINSSVPIKAAELVPKSSSTEQVRSAVTAVVDTVDSAVSSHSPVTPTQRSAQCSGNNQIGVFQAVRLADDERSLHRVKWKENRCTAQWRKVKHKSQMLKQLVDDSVSEPEQTETEEESMEQFQLYDQRRQLQSGNVHREFQSSPSPFLRGQIQLGDYFRAGQTKSKYRRSTRLTAEILVTSNEQTFSSTSIPELATSVPKLSKAVLALSTAKPKPFAAVPAPPTSVQKPVTAVPEPSSLIPKLFTAVIQTRQQLNEPEFNSNSDCDIKEQRTPTSDEIKPDDYGKRHQIQH
jgi:hypothetical protein